MRLHRGTGVPKHMFVDDPPPPSNVCSTQEGARRYTWLAHANACSTRIGVRGTGNGSVVPERCVFAGSRRVSCTFSQVNARFSYSRPRAVVCVVPWMRPHPEHTTDWSKHGLVSPTTET